MGAERRELEGGYVRGGESSAGIGAQAGLRGGLAAVVDHLEEERSDWWMYEPLRASSVERSSCSSSRSRSRL
jgi:hypothetical protein